MTNTWAIGRAFPRLRLLGDIRRNPPRIVAPQQGSTRRVSASRSQNLASVSHAHLSSLSLQMFALRRHSLTSRRLLLLSDIGQLAYPRRAYQIVSLPWRSGGKEARRGGSRLMWRSCQSCCARLDAPGRLIMGVSHRRRDGRFGRKPRLGGDLLQIRSEFPRSPSQIL